MTSCLTINGRVRFSRTVFWNKQQGTVVPLDNWLGLDVYHYSPGVREMCCREASSNSFCHAAENLSRIGQIKLSHETVRKIIETEGMVALERQKRGLIKPGWTADDCRDLPEKPSCIITGADGVKIPLITEEEKVKRRQRRGPKPKGQSRRRYIRKGSDQKYKEFKIIAFYDPSHERQYAVGTSGDHEILGRMMRRLGRSIEVDKADIAYSVTDGAGWILKQYQSQLPMLKANVLDYYHLREHVIETSYKLFGENSKEALLWRNKMMGVVLEKGPVELLQYLGDMLRKVRSKIKRDSLKSLRNYIAKRLDMLDYPAFKKSGYEIGSGPTEAFCKTLTLRLKGPGMRWDKVNAEAVMTLASLRASGLWDEYWKPQQKQTA